MSSCAAIDECSSSPCVNGDCKPLLNGFECCCNPGFNGQFCENGKIYIGSRSSYIMLQHRSVLSILPGYYMKPPIPFSHLINNSKRPLPAYEKNRPTIERELFLDSHEIDDCVFVVVLCQKSTSARRTRAFVATASMVRTRSRASVHRDTRDSSARQVMHACSSILARTYLYSAFTEHLHLTCWR